MAVAKRTSIKKSTKKTTKKVVKKATKKKAVSLKGRSEAWLKTQSTAKNKIVESDASAIKRLYDQITAAKKKIDKADDYLAKANGYNSQRDAYDSLASRIAKAQEQLKKAPKSKQKGIKAQIKNLQGQKSAVAKTIKKITSSPKYSKYWTQRKNAKNTVTHLGKTKKAKATKKANDKAVAKRYNTAYNAAKAKAHAALVKKNTSLIGDKIKAAKKATGWHAGYTTAVFRADYKTSRVFLMGEVSPSESIDQNHTTHTVDGKDSRITHGSRSSKQLSATYYLLGDSFSKLDQQYRIFEGWQKKNVELIVRGFSKWNHAYISSIGKTMDTPYKNVLALPITFDYEMPAHIKMAKKSKKKTKAAAKKKKGSSKSSKKYVVVKSGMTYWWIARHYHVSISWLEKNNKWSARKIPVGVKVRYK